MYLLGTNCMPGTVLGCYFAISYVYFTVVKCYFHFLQSKWYYSYVHLGVQGARTGQGGGEVLNTEYLLHH